MTDNCDRCGHEFTELKTIPLGEDRELCDGCIGALRDSIDFFDWMDRYTEEQHERALSLLGEYDEFECVISSYEDGQIVLHTPYVTSNVVTDFCNHFRYDIISFGPMWNADAEWPCLPDHGDVFQIVLEYNHSCDPPMPLSVAFDEDHIKDIDGNDKQF